MSHCVEMYWMSEGPQYYYMMTFWQCENKWEPNDNLLANFIVSGNDNMQMYEWSGFGHRVKQWAWNVAQVRSHMSGVGLA